MMPLTIEKIRQCLTDKSELSREDTSPLLKRAAVLVPLIHHQGKWHLLFTRRTDTVHDHKGQVSFPGGAREPQDESLVTTAIREACEEIGLCLDAIEILGMLRDIKTISNYKITPVVGWIKTYPFEIIMNHAEVSKVFTIPIAWLADPVNWDERIRIFPNRQEETVVYFQPYEGEVVWGITARITLTLLQVLEIIP